VGEEPEGKSASKRRISLWEESRYALLGCVQRAYGRPATEQPIDGSDVERNSEGITDLDLAHEGEGGDGKKNADDDGG
jgi:hypothetical protein